MSVLVVLVEGLVFLSSVYLFKSSRSGHRNDSTVIRYRLLGGGIATMICIFISSSYSSNLFQNWLVMDFSCLSASYLYLGQLLLDIYLGREAPDLSLITLRDLVLGPLYEEVVFRGAMIPLLSSNSQKIFVSSLVFALSHVHHGILEYLRGINSLKHSIVACMFQFTYTFIFGLVSSYYFVKTGSLIGVVLLHSICNYFGVPDFNITSNDQKLIFWCGTLIGLYLFINTL